MESTAHRLRPPARWFAAGLVTLMLLSMLPFAGGVAADAGPGTQLVFTTQPVGGVAYGTNLAAQPVVEIRNASGQVVTSGGDETAAVTLTLLAPAVGGPGALVCDATTVNATAGVAAFTGCRVNTNSGAGYRLQASATLTGSPVTANSATFTINSAAPAKVVYTTQPGGGTGGSAWAQQPVAQIQDAANQIAVQDSASVIALAITTNPGTGTLSCTGGQSKVVTNGTATFAGCAIDKIGNGYVVTASSGALTPAASNPFNITLGAAAKLVFTVQPAGNVGVGVNLPTQPVVAVTDAGGNVITTDSTTQVTLAITGGTPAVGGPGSLACNATTVTVAAGLATFAGCKINNDSGAGYKLHATSSPAYTAADSAAFTINSGVATQLAFSTQPGGGTGGVVWPQQPVVQVRDASGDVVVSDSTTIVTLSIGTNPATGTLTCTGGLSKVVTNGQATFEGCTIDKAGTGYKLFATSSPWYTSATSGAFNVTIGPATKLTFTAQPGASNTNVPFPVQPVVAITDAGGNTVTTAPATTVTLSIGTNPGAGTLACTGGLSRTTVSGAATFSGCYITNAGTGYTLVATATGYTLATSAAFNVTALAADISLTAYPTPINRGGTSTLTIQFASLGAGRQVTLQKKTALDYDWVTVSTLTMDSTGRATVPVAPGNTTSYRVVFAGAADLSGATSSAVKVGVRYSVTLQPRSASGTRTLARGTSVTYRATVRPVYSGQRVTFMIYEKVSGRWTFRTSATATANSSGVATFTWRWSRPGQWYIRARANSTPLNVTAYSNIEKVVIR